MSDSLTLDDQIIVAIRQISQAIESYSRFLATEFELTSPQLASLREIERSGKSTPGQLSERLHISPQTVAGIIKRLEKRGLLVRSRDPDDRRSFCLELTPKGKQLSAAASSLLRDEFRQKLDQLDLWERTQVLANMQRVAAMMNADSDDETPYFFHKSQANGEPATDGEARSA